MEVVRTPLGPDVRLPTHRTRQEQLIVRWPRAWAAGARALQRLPPRSRMRRVLLGQNAISGWGAWVRGDLELCQVRFARDYEYDPPREWLLPGMPTAYRGHAGLRQWAHDLREAWDFLDHTPLEIVDAGDVIAFLCQIRLRARRSGVELDSRLGQVFWLERGLVVRERDFGDWAEALRVLGVNEGSG
ncbi:MAG: nuclear transport factor 2 family protein [Solirubrobacteraceae bacterium]